MSCWRVPMVLHRPVFRSRSGRAVCQLLRSFDIRGIRFISSTFRQPLLRLQPSSRCATARVTAAALMLFQVQSASRISTPAIRPTVTAKFDSFKVLDAQGSDITGTLTAKQRAAVAAIEANLVVVPGAGNAGTATWTYSVADRALDFLGAGRTLVLTYKAQIDTSFVGISTTVFTPFTIKISSPRAG